MLFDPRQDIGQVEDGSRWRADRMRKRLEGERAKIERQALEGRVRSTASSLTDTSACAGREGIFRGPLGMCDLYATISDDATGGTF